MTDMRPVTIHIWVEKKSDMTQEEFRDYWAKIHSKLFLEFTAVRKHLLRYEQWQIDSEERKYAEEAFGLEYSGWDGLAVATFDSIEGARACFQDPAIAKFAADDEPRFCKYPSVTLRFAVVGKPHIAWNQGYAG